MLARLLIAALVLGTGSCHKAAPESSKPSDERAARESEELEDEIPPGQGSCCADNRCRFSEYPGRREWQQACREQNAEPGQWCSGECTLDIDARPPACVCL